GLGSGSGLLTRPSSATADLPGPTEGPHLETFGPPEDDGRGRPHRTRNERHEKLMRKMRAEKDKDDKKSMRRHGAKNADYRGGVTCLYDTQLLGECLHASECGGCYRPGAVRGMPDVPIAPSATARRLSALSAQPLSTGGCGRVCLGFWVLDLCFWGRKVSGSGSAAHHAVGLAGESPVVGID